MSDRKVRPPELRTALLKKRARAGKPQEHSQEWLCHKYGRCLCHQGQVLGLPRQRRR